MSRAKGIRYGYFAVAVLCFVVFIASGYASNDALQELSGEEREKIIEKFRSFHKDIRSLSASVSQEKHLSALKEKLQVEGTVTMARPDKLRWDTVKPERSHTVIDGETMTVYHPDIKEAQVYALSEHVIARNTMGFFTTAMGGALDEMEKKFSVKIYRNGNEIIYKLQPLSGMTRKYLSAVSISYAEATGLPRGFEVTTPKGDRTITTLTHITINPEIKPETFTMKLPGNVWVTNKFEETR